MHCLAAAGYSSCAKQLRPQLLGVFVYFLFISSSFVLVYLCIYILFICIFVVFVLMYFFLLILAFVFVQLEFQLCKAAAARTTMDRHADSRIHFKVSKRI